MAYQLSDLRRRVRANLKDTSFNQTTIDDAIDDAQLEIAELFYWKFLEKSVSGALTVDEYTFEQQSDHMTTLKLILIHPTSTTTIYNLSKNYLNPDDFFERFPAPDTTESGTPHYWTEFGDQIYFDRPADLAYTMRQYYYKRPTELTGDSDVPDYPREFREAIVLGANYRCERTRRNYDYASILQNDFNDKVEDHIERQSNRQLATAEAVINPISYNQDY